MDVLDPQYVKTEDGAYIAYQVVGDGPVDVAWLFDFTGNLNSPLLVVPFDTFQPG